jgi:hypothetical protein
VVLSLRPDSEAQPASSSTPRRGVGAVLLVAAALLFAYVVIYPLFGLKVTIGSDTPVYVWWARLGGAVGMGPLGSGTRPGVVGLVATLARVTPAPAAGVVAALLPAFAVTTGLAAGALADVALGPDRVRFVLVASFTGAYLSLLTDGYVSTLGFGAAFVGALACFAAALPGPGDAARPRPGTGALVAAGGLVAAAGLSHPLFLVVAAGVLGTGLVAMVPGALRQHRSGTGFGSLGVVRILVAAVAGVAAVALGLLSAGGFAAAPVETSRDAFLRKAGLGSVLRASYVHKLRHDFPWYRVATVVGLAATALGVARRATRDAADRWALFWGAMLGWIVVSAAGVVLLLAGTSAPGQRLLAFCLALPILAGVGLAGIWGHARSDDAGAHNEEAGGDAARRSRLVRRVAVVCAACLFLGLAWGRWLGLRPLFSPQQLTQARDAGIALIRTPSGTPLAVVVDPRGAQPSELAIRNDAYLRDEVAVRDIPHVHVVMGSVPDVLAGRPTVTGDREYDAYSRMSVSGLRGLPAPLALSLRSFDARAYAEALATPGHSVPAPGMVALPPSVVRTPIDVTTTVPTQVGPGPQSPWLPVWEGVLVLALAALAGWPLGALLVGGAGPTARAALAPSLGFAALTLASVAIDGVGLHLSSAGGWAALALAVLPGWIAFALRTRRERGGVASAA